MSYEREVDVSLTKQAEVSGDKTTVTTTATRTVRTEVTTPAPAESGLRRREVKSSGTSSSNSRFLPCEYYGRQAGAGVLADEDEELERRQARDLVRAIENRREQPTSLSSYGEQKSYASSGTQENSFDRFGTATEEEEEEEEQEVEETDEAEEDYNQEGNEQEEEEEEEEVDRRQEKKRLDAMKRKSEQYVKRVAKEVDDARHKAKKVKQRATAAAKRAVSWYPSPTTAFLLRLLIGSLLGALLCLATYEYFFSWGPSRPVYFADGTIHHLPPGSKAGSWGIPYVGETIDYYRDPFKFTLRHAEKYGPISYSNVLGDHTVMLSGLRALGQVFYNASLVQRRDALPKSIARLLGRDILPALDNSRHAEVRAIIMQAINTRGVIQAHLSNLDRVMNQHMAQWTMESIPFDLLRAIKGMTASMASTLFFTNDESAFLAPLLDDVLAALSAYPSPLTGSTYSRGVLARDQLIGWYERAIADHAREIEARSNKYNGDVLDLMLKLTHKIPDITHRHLAHELHYLVLSTYELYNPISAVFVAMEQYPDWVPLLREEVDAMHLDPEYPALPFDKLHRIDLLSLFINETRRFYPAAVVEWGKAKLTFFYDGYVIPEGFKLMASVAATHLDEAEHKNARAFDPTRFADELENTYGFVPHGGGARDSASSHRCLGEDLSFYTVKLFLMNLFSRHDWRLAAGQNVNFDTAHYLPQPHALQASSFINTTSALSFSQFAPTVPFDPHLTSDHIAVAVA